MYVWSTHRSESAAIRSMRAAIKAMQRWDAICESAAGVHHDPPASDIFFIEHDNGRYTVMLDEPSLAPSQQSSRA